MRVDWYVPCNTPKVLDISNELYELIPIKSKGANRNSREKKLRNTCHQIISSLYRNHFSLGRADNPVTTYKSPRYFSATQYDPEKINIPYRAFMEVYETLISSGWASEELGQKGLAITKLKSSKFLKSKFDDIGLVWDEQPIKRDEELLIMRDIEINSSGEKVKKTVNLSDYNDRQLHLSNLKLINTALVSHCISLDLSDKNLAKVHIKDIETHEEWDDRSYFNKALMIDNVQLSRIFARGSVKLGGRFYRGWWQGIPSIHRPHIRINGYKTEEVDFSGIGIKILYTMANEVFDKEDPYDIGLQDWEGKSDKRRKTVKKALNALINDIDGNYKLKSKEINILGLNNKKFKELVHKTHKPIRHLFQTKAGLEAQFIDSQIAESVMLQMIEKGGIALPIHDSFIVRLGHKGLLLHAMKEACKKVIGLEISTTNEYIKTAEHFGLKSNDLSDLSNNLSVGISNGNDVKSLIFRQPTIMDNYLASFENFKAGVFK